MCCSKIKYGNSQVLRDVRLLPSTSFNSGGMNSMLVLELFFGSFISKATPGQAQPSFKYFYCFCLSNSVKFAIIFIFSGPS